MPEDGGRRGVRRGGGVGGKAPSAQPLGGASSSGTHEAGSSQESEQMLSGNTVYIPGFDGSQGQVHVDLNEPASDPSQLFMTQAGTPPSAYMPDPYVMVSDPAPALAHMTPPPLREV
ncbi:hypothetical protein PIB30_080451 [Stylosanthes scabra]|uniref:Uncharacterized protein n=1 Tax=Stylosanthes scabra TaxID=79078 RepID=A0ABU6QSA8_9FABA|nr:hypothetical protein [Stylosanthes scabra]